MRRRIYAEPQSSNIEYSAWQRPVSAFYCRHHLKAPSHDLHLVKLRISTHTTVTSINCTMLEYH